MSKETYVKPYERRNKKRKGKHTVSGHTRSQPSKNRSERRSPVGGARRHEREYIEQIEDMGAEVITDPEKIYWDDMYEKSIALKEKVDIRQNYKKKPIIIKTEDEKIMIEWDYAPYEASGWLIYNDRGDVIDKEDKKSYALMDVKYYLEDW